jgi:hypothetical protein
MVHCVAAPYTLMIVRPAPATAPSVTAYPGGGRPPKNAAAAHQLVGAPHPIDHHVAGADRSVHQAKPGRAPRTMTTRQCTTIARKNEAMRTPRRAAAKWTLAKDRGAAMEG